MITVHEISRKMERLYEELLRTVAMGDQLSFPFRIRADKKLSKHFTEWSGQLEELIANSSDRKGFGYSITYATINTREHGVQSIPEAILINTETDLLLYLGKQEEFACFKRNVALIADKFPQLRSWMRGNARKVVAYQNDWDHILSVLSFLSGTTERGFYIREISAAPHSKFIEARKSLFYELLNLILDPATIHDAFVGKEYFQERFGLRKSPYMQRFKILDRRIADKFFSGISDLSVPLDAFKRLQLPVSSVVIIENKTSIEHMEAFLCFPDVAGTIAIWGSGYASAMLKEVQWLEDTEIWYWGDIDAEGFHILSKLRERFPRLRSFCMDMETLNAFISFSFSKKFQPFVYSRLTTEELLVVERLAKENIMLEQEFVSPEYVKKCLYDYGFFLYSPAT